MNASSVKILAAAGLLASATSSHALIIDDFNTGAAVILTDAAPETGSASTAAAAGMIGDREIFVNKFEGALGASNAAIAEVTGGLLSMSNGPATNSNITVTWAPFATSPTDLTEGGTATGIFLALPNPIDNDLTIEFTLNGGSTYTRVFPDGSQGSDFFVPFSGFTDPGAAAAATSFEVMFSDALAWDAQIDFIETRPQPIVPVPVPGTLALLGLGLAGLGIRRGKRS